MTKNTSFDFLIIGQGIAGTILSYKLIKAGYKVLVADESKKESASKVAAGLYNPIVLKRFSKIWKADELANTASNFYKEFEKELEEKFDIQSAVNRVFHNSDEKKKWLELAKTDFKEHLSDIILPTPNGIIGDNGVAEVYNTGWLDTETMLKSYRAYLKANDSVVEKEININEIGVKETHAEWNQLQFKKMIFCQGPDGLLNPYFNYLPLKQTKGELITIECKRLNLNYIIKGDPFIIPIGNDLYRVGATFNWTEKNTIPSEEGLQELKEKLSKLLNLPYTVIEHRAGLRPTVKDRRALIGFHPKYKNIGIFNGMGTRGVLLAPYLANMFVDNIKSGADLDPEVDIKRYEAEFKASLP